MKYMNRFKVPYVVLVIRKFAEYYSLQTRQAYEYLKRHGGIDFIDNCYEAEHLLSIDDAIEDLSVVCHNNGGGLIYA